MTLIGHWTLYRGLAWVFMQAGPHFNRAWCRDLEDLYTLEVAPSPPLRGSIKFAWRCIIRFRQKHRRASVMNWEEMISGIGMTSSSTGLFLFGVVFPPKKSFRPVTTHWSVSQLLIRFRCWRKPNVQANMMPLPRVRDNPSGTNPRMQGEQNRYLCKF